MPLPILTVSGNLTADPELRFTPNGKAVVNIRIACSDRYFDKSSNEWRDSDPCFISASGWGQLAENVAESLAKGDPVVLSGKLMEEHWNDSQTGQQRSRFNVKMMSCGPDLTLRQAKPVRVERSQGGADPWQGQPQQPQQAPQQRPQQPPQQGLSGTPWGQQEQQGAYGEPPF